MTPRRRRGGWTRTSAWPASWRAPRADAAVRAYHVARCARPGDAAAIAVLSEAAAAAAGTAPTVAAHWYQAALRLLPGRPPERRADLLVALARALGSAGRLEDSRAAFVEALELRHGLGRRAARAQIACARVETQLGRHADARRRLLAVRAPRRRELALRLAFELAAATLSPGPRARAARVGRPAVQAATEADEPLLAGAAALAAWARCGIGELDRATARACSATSRADELDDAALATRLAVAVYVGNAQFLCERFVAPAATSARALRDLAPDRRRPAGVTLLGLRAIVALKLLELDIGAGGRRRPRRSRGYRRASRTCCTSRSGSARSCTTSAASAPRPSAARWRARG